MENKKEEKKVTEKSGLINIIELIAIIIFIIVVLAMFPNTIIWNIVVLLLILSVLIFVHELGHFIMAKKFGVHVYEFAIGMGPVVVSFKRKNDETLYSIRAFPIGGYNQLAGESYEDDEDMPKNEFMCNKPKWQRVLILIAGVTMNLITAFILLFAISFAYGSTDSHSYIGSVLEDSPASDAGLVVGDQIVQVNGYGVSTWDKIAVVNAMKNESGIYTYVIRHDDGSISSYQLTPAKYVVTSSGDYRITDERTEEDIVASYNLSSSDYTVSSLVGLGAPTEVHHGFNNALKYACTKLKSIVSSMLLIIGSLFTGKISLDALSGPVGMYTVVDQVAKFGLANILYLTAYLSINLAVVNLLPFPAFDGGHILFVIIELITRKKTNQKIEGWLNTIGFILIMLLMVIITFKDILKLFT
ncbi:MAG TPA: site-2 protease family protein [Bacilli bacterium]|jgi:regulator of sigma E protease|nr:site-2 protease family protein [Bacilli bacterium]